MQIHVAKTLRKHHPLDCDRDILEAKLKAYDKQLYLEYSVHKECWELRRLPEQKHTFCIAKNGEQNIFMVHYVEQYDINHVYDLPVLSYDVLDRLRESDMWVDQDLSKAARLLEERREYNRKKYVEEQTAKNKAELKYSIRQNRKYFADLKEEFRSGRLNNPFAVFSQQKKSK